MVQDNLEGQRSQVPEPQLPSKPYRTEPVQNGEEHREDNNFFSTSQKAPASSVDAEDPNVTPKGNITSDSFYLDIEETKPELSDDEDYKDENDDEIKALQVSKTHSSTIAGGTEFWYELNFIWRWELRYFWQRSENDERHCMVRVRN